MEGDTGELRFTKYLSPRLFVKHFINMICNPYRCPERWTLLTLLYKQKHNVREVKPSWQTSDLGDSEAGLRPPLVTGSWKPAAAGRRPSPSHQPVAQELSL